MRLVSLSMNDSDHATIKILKACCCAYPERHPPY